MIDQSDVSYLEYHARKFPLHVDPVFPNLPIRFKQRYVPRTFFNSHLQWQNVNKPQKKIMASTKQTHTFVIIRRVFFLLLRLQIWVWLLMSCRWHISKSLRKVIIVVTARHFLVFLTLCTLSSNSVKIWVKIALNPRESLQELTHLTAGTNKFQIIVIPTSLWFSNLNQLPMQLFFHLSTLSWIW